MVNWIAPLVESLISSYLNNKVEGLEMEDDGSNLRFPNDSHKHALVVDWKDIGERSATLMDSHTQIKAVLTRMSLEKYQAEESHHKLSGDTTRWRCIQLLDFEVVFEYSGGRPDVHLYVKSFKIDKKREKSKSLQGIKLIRKNGHIYKLMEKLFHVINESQPAEDTAVISDGDCSDDSVHSQNEKSAPVISQEMLMSQLAPISHTTISSISNGSRGRHSLCSTQLLGYLHCHDNLSTRAVISEKSPSVLRERQASDGRAGSYVNKNETTGGNQGNESTSSHQTLGSAATDVVTNVPNTAAFLAADACDSEFHPIDSERHGQPSSVEQLTSNNATGDHDEAEGPLADQQQGGDHSGDHNSHTVAHLRPSEAYNVSVESSQQETNMQSGGLQPDINAGTQAMGKYYSSSGDRLDPWEGMTKIPRRDIRIPKDQRHLLEHTNSQCWIPPELGKNMPRGHVPPSLLEQWNSISLRRERIKRARKDDLMLNAPEHREMSIHDIASSAPQADTELSDEESEGSEEHFPWGSPSPVCDPSTRLPKDSSPIREFPNVRKADSPREQAENCLDGQFSEVASQVVTREGARCRVSESPQSSVHRVALDSDSRDKGHNHNYQESDKQINVPKLVTSVDASNERFSGGLMVDTKEDHEDQGPERQDILLSEPPTAAAAETGEHSPRDSFPNDTEDNGGESQPTEQNIHSELFIAVGTESDNGSVLDGVGNEELAREHASSKPAASTGWDGELESDNDSVMDISVPCPLRASSQLLSEASQIEQEITSSGPSLPGLNTDEQIQVSVTPTDLKRLRPARFEKDKPDWEVYVAQQPSSQAAKSSSQSRILNTYRSHEDHEQDEPSQKMVHSSAEHELYRVDVMGTQTDSQGTTSRSQPPVQDSSGPDDHQQTTRVGTVEIQGNEGSGMFSSSGGLAQSQFDGEGHRTPGQFSPVKSVRDNSPIINLKRSRSSSGIETNEEPPSKRYRFYRDESDDKFVGEFKGPASNIVSRRESYMGSSSKEETARRLYEKFRSDYAGYWGDFSHFVELCARLQALRGKGELRRSFLWDDFVIMHLQEYPQYVEQCHSTGTEALKYEDFFISKFFKPVHKKRSLTVAAIEIAAAQYRSASRSSVPASPSLSRRSIPLSEVNVSTTASLVDRLTNFHTFSSVRDAPSNSPGIRTDASSASVFVSPPARAAPKEPDRDATPRQRDLFVETIKSSEPEVDMTPQPEPSFLLPEVIAGPSREGTAADGNDDEDDEEIEVEAHETASIELGDEPRPSSRTSSDAYISAVEFDPKSEHEPQPNKGKEPEDDWFASMAHLHPTGPVWSDSPSTPFKAWARADQNVIVERKHRRGLPVPVDEKGVIIPTYFT
ncbi:hypothetical protein MPDQ_000559 [Monascus purpureus]|uniref:Shelterin complex subunit TPP1/Est3 domain-containing protein n=1 Tax=Monascus purpureus TaxID=5098 RepID=A0A507R4M1_MONPU|nr:hypothetical protein MPDQ_000559 [Monascus purpureus]